MKREERRCRTTASGQASKKEFGRWEGGGGRKECVRAHEVLRARPLHHLSNIFFETSIPELFQTAQRGTHLAQRLVVVVVQVMARVDA